MNPSILTLFVSAVLINILISHIFPISYSYFPSSLKGILNSYHKVILSHRENLLNSSIFAIILVYCTVILTPVVDIYVRKLQLN